MRALITLTPAEGKRLIAKAVASMPAVRRALDTAYVLLAEGTTTAMVYQEITGDQTICPEKCAVGLITDGRLCVTDPADRTAFPQVLLKGEAQPRKSFAEALSDHHKDTVIIKGANAIDEEGAAGIITTGFDGGSITKLIGPAVSRGLTVIVPAGLEKLVPSVERSAGACCGADHFDIAMGAPGGMFCLHHAVIVTEIDALRQLFGVESDLICRGGVGGSEGSVTLAAAGSEDSIRAMQQFLEENVKGEPPIPGNKGNCRTCRYPECGYHEG